MIKKDKAKDKNIKKDKVKKKLHEEPIMSRMKFRKVEVAPEGAPVHTVA
jgi:hypothetical protein